MEFSLNVGPEGGMRGERGEDNPLWHYDYILNNFILWLSDICTTSHAHWMVFVWGGVPFLFLQFMWCSTCPLPIFLYFACTVSVTPKWSSDIGHSSQQKCHIPELFHQLQNLPFPFMWFLPLFVFYFPQFHNLYQTVGIISLLFFLLGSPLNLHQWHRKFPHVN